MLVSFPQINVNFLEIFVQLHPILRYQKTFKNLTLKKLNPRAISPQKIIRYIYFTKIEENSIFRAKSNNPSRYNEKNSLNWWLLNIWKNIENHFALDMECRNSLLSNIFSFFPSSRFFPFFPFIFPSQSVKIQQNKNYAFLNLNNSLWHFQSNLEKKKKKRNSTRQRV